MLGKSSSGSELKWLEPKLDCFDPKLLLSQGYRRLCHAFRLLLTDPTVKVNSWFWLLMWAFFKLGQGPILPLDNLRISKLFYQKHFWHDWLKDESFRSDCTLPKFQMPCSYSSPSSSLLMFCLDLCLFLSLDSYLFQL